MWDYVPKCSPMDWWVLRSTDDALLPRLAAKMMALPATTDAAESCWSEWKYVVDPYRNSLTPQHQAESVAVYHNLRQKRKLELQQ